MRSHDLLWIWIWLVKIMLSADQDARAHNGWQLFRLQIQIKSNFLKVASERKSSRKDGKLFWLFLSENEFYQVIKDLQLELS